MRNTNDETSSSSMMGPRGQKPALQVICLGASGGPSEENVTAFLVRSVGSNWSKGSLLAVDAGSHLAPITRILERDFPAPSSRPRRTQQVLSQSQRAGSVSPTTSEEEEEVKPEPTILTKGPFAGLEFPNATDRANALHLLRSYISTYLITHPHLDHISGFTINTAAFHATSRPKTLAALPSTVDAIKTHIFNDVIWPNLSDEDGGVGFVTFQRLKEGGDVMMGEGEGRGYIDVVDGLGVRAFKVSHGVCTKSPPAHHHRGSIAGQADGQMTRTGSMSMSDFIAPAMGRSLSTGQHAQFSTPGTPGGGRQGQYTSQPSPRGSVDMGGCVVDSTAYFIRDTETQREVLIFGDVEPDSLSLTPRNRIVWQEAARKIAYGLLGGIFIESSYDDSQVDAILFGHLNPRHLIAELQTLASLVVEAKAQRAQERLMKKRKRSGANGSGLEASARHALTGDGDAKRKRSISGLSASRRSSVPYNLHSTIEPQQTVGEDTVMQSSPSTDKNEPRDSHRGSMSPRSVTFPSSLATVASFDHGDPPRPYQDRQQHFPGELAVSRPDGVSDPRKASQDSSASGPDASSADRDLPLAGIKVVIIHVKDTMTDGPHVSENIYAQLQEHEENLRMEGQALGCEFVISKSGESYWF